MMNLTVFKYAMLRGIKTPMSIILNSVAPIGLTIFAGRINMFGAPYIELYLIAFMVMFGAFMMAGSIQKDKTEGVLIRILAGPVTLRSYLVQNFFAAMVPMMAVSAVIALLGFVMHDWSLTLCVGLFLVYIFLAATSIGLSFAWSCLFKDKEASMSGISLFLTFTAMLGGFMIPLAVLPDALFYIGMLFPAHWASRAIAQLVAYGEFTGMFGLSLVALTGFAAALILYGSKRRLV